MTDDVRDEREDDESERFDGYHDCPCCGETHLHETALCWDCRVAECEQEKIGEDADGEFWAYQDCQIPECEHCGTRAMLCTSFEWSSNCDEGCPNAGKHWPEPRAEKVPR